MTTIDVRKYFNTDLPAALLANAGAARAIGARYQLGILGPDGGDWTVDLTARGPSCKPGKSSADCTLTLTDTNFRVLCERPELNAVQLYMSGKLKVEGNTAVALKLGKILALVNLPKAVKSTPPAPPAAKAVAAAAASAGAPKVAAKT
jgi:hypothetical protein